MNVREYIEMKGQECNHKTCVLTFYVKRFNLVNRFKNFYLGKKVDFFFFQNMGERLKV